MPSLSSPGTSPLRRRNSRLGNGFLLFHRSSYRSSGIMLKILSSESVTSSKFSKFSSSHQVSVQRFSVKNVFQKRNTGTPSASALLRFKHNHALSVLINLSLVRVLILDQTAGDPCIAQETELWLLAGFAIVWFL